MNKLTDEHIEYIREWATSGNEPRDLYAVDGPIAFATARYVCVSVTGPGAARRKLKLSPAGLTIAAQAEENARLTAELEKAEAERDAARQRVTELGDHWSAETRRAEGYLARHSMPEAEYQATTPCAACGSKGLDPTPELGKDAAICRGCDVPRVLPMPEEQK